MGDVLKAPFPYFGGKSKVADMVWARLGDPRNYVEPFAGSLAVLMRRPNAGQIETVNDRNHFIVNFWRAVKADPEQVAYHADHPVTESDLHARHRFLMFSDQAQDAFSRVAHEPEAFDAKLAGWWVWGQCCWIGNGWCDTSSTQIPCLSGDAGAYGRGVVSSAGHKKPINRGVVGLGRPQLGDAYDIGRGVNSNQSAGTCQQRLRWLTDWMERLADRLRLVRVCYGHWDRICDSHTTMGRLGETGAFLDPPYAHDCQRVQDWIARLLGEGEPPVKTAATNRAKSLYSGDESQDIDRLVAEVNLWCRKWGADPNIRIAVCGYEGEHDSLESLGWEVVEWKAHGGYGNRNTENENKHRERLWFSPACVQSSSSQLELF